VALVGFGVDSGIELAASLTALFRLARDPDVTMVCTWLSAILLAGLALNALVGWWWADPVAALMMVPLIAREGIEGLRGHASCCDEC
jgi:hypothetical protein